MTHGKAALGKIFISHSSTDKRWVRRFERSLRDAGYDTWLDEKEIEVGDALAAKVSEGVRDAKVVVVVVSAASVVSQWLRFELDIATERMIRGDCRVLPILIDDVEMPPEISGRLYADMRPRRRGGLARVLRALESEADKYPAPSTPLTMDSTDSWVRRQAYERFLTDLADGWFSATMDVSAVRSLSFEGLSIGERDVIVDFVSVYSLRDELSEHDYDDWRSRVSEELNETCGLLVTEKPPSLALTQRLGFDNRVGGEAIAGLFKPTGSLVVADLSEDLTDSQARDILRRAYNRVKESVDNAAPPLIDPKTLPRSE